MLLLLPLCYPFGGSDLPQYCPMSVPAPVRWGFMSLEFKRVSYSEMSAMMLKDVSNYTSFAIVITVETKETVISLSMSSSNMTTNVRNIFFFFFN